MTRLTRPTSTCAALLACCTLAATGCSDDEASSKDEPLERRPMYKPASSSTLGDKATPASGFDARATFAGAVDPDGEDWTVGWTTFAEN